MVPSPKSLAWISSDYFESLVLPQLRGENDSKQSDEFQATKSSLSAKNKTFYYGGHFEPKVKLTFSLKHLNFSNLDKKMSALLTSVLYWFHPQQESRHSPLRDIRPQSCRLRTEMLGTSACWLHMWPAWFAVPLKCLKNAGRVKENTFGFVSWR